MAVDLGEGNTTRYYLVSDSPNLSYPDGDWCVGFWSRVEENSGTAFQYLFSHGTVSTDPSLNIWIEEDTGVSAANVWKFDFSGGGNVLSSKATGADRTDRLIVVQRRDDDGELQMWFCEPNSIAEKVASTGNLPLGVKNPAGPLNIGRREDGNVDRYYEEHFGEVFKGDFSLSKTEIELLAAGNTVLGLDTAIARKDIVVDTSNLKTVKGEALAPTQTVSGVSAAPGVDRLMIVVIGNEDADTTINSVVLDPGGADEANFIQAVSAFGDGPTRDSRASIWYLPENDIPSSAKDVQVTFAQFQSAAIVKAGITLVGVDQAQPLGATGTASSTVSQTSLTIPITTITDGSVVLTGLTLAGPTVATPDSSQTLIDTDTVNLADNMGMGIARRAFETKPSSPADLSWTFAAEGRSAMVAAEFRAAVKLKAYWPFQTAEEGDVGDVINELVATQNGSGVLTSVHFPVASPPRTIRVDLENLLVFGDDASETPLTEDVASPTTVPAVSFSRGTNRVGIYTMVSEGHDLNSVDRVVIDPGGPDEAHFLKAVDQNTEGGAGGSFSNLSSIWYLPDALIPNDPRDLEVHYTHSTTSLNLALVHVTGITLHGVDQTAPLGATSGTELESAAVDITDMQAQLLAEAHSVVLDAISINNPNLTVTPDAGQTLIASGASAVGDSHVFGISYEVLPGVDLHRSHGYTFSGGTNRSSVVAAEFRAIPTTVADELAKRVVHPILLAEFEFPSGFVRFWSGVGNLIFNGGLFVGSGDLGMVQPATETVTMDATGASFMLSGLNDAAVTAALQESYQNRPCRLWLAVLDDLGRIVDAEQIFEGRMDIMSPEIGVDQATIVLSAENVLISKENPAGGTYTPEDQKQRFPGDTLFDTVTELQDAVILWGSADP